jgi:hypothetical protein
MQSDLIDLTETASIHKNPFWLLWVSTRDSSQRIVDSADEKALVLNPEVCENARTTLTNPRKRLTAEMSWLPGVSPTRAWQVATALKGGFVDNMLAIGLPPLARSNALCSAIELQPDDAPPVELSEHIVALAKSTEEIESQLIFDQVNEDRAVAKFPLVKDVAVIEEEMAERWRAYRNAVKDLLDRQPTNNIVAVMNSIVDRATSRGTHPASRLIEELVDSYEVESQSFVHAAMRTLRGLIDKAKTLESDERAIRATLVQLWKLADNWNLVLKPVQLVSKTRGIDHAQSKEFAVTIRGLGLYLNNERAMPEIAKDLAKALQSKFSTLAEFSERLVEDVTTLDEVIEEQAAAAQQQKEWEKSITYSADVGVVLKEELRISPDGVAWKGQLLPLSSISRVRWGGTRHSVNGIPTGSTYEIHIANDKTRITINLRNSTTFSSFTEKLWRAVGPRLMVDYLTRLKAGESIAFGCAIVSDDNLVIPRHKFFSSEAVRLNWHQVKIWSADGSFVLASTAYKKTYAALSYLGLDNIHVLETIIRASFKNGHSRLSVSAKLRPLFRF